MTNSRDLILEMKRVQKEHNYSYGDMSKMMEANGDKALSPATFSRLFSDGSEDNISFSYEYTLVPLARAILDIDNIEADDTNDVKILKETLKIKHARLKELEHENETLRSEIDKLKIKHHEKLDKERTAWAKSIEFMKEQVAYKDKRMDMLLEAVFEKDRLHKEMLEKVLKCSKCPLGDKNEG